MWAGARTGLVCAQLKSVPGVVKSVRIDKVVTVLQVHLSCAQYLMMHPASVQALVVLTRQTGQLQADTSLMESFTVHGSCGCV